MKYLVMIALAVAVTGAAGKEYPFEKAKWDCHRDTGPGSVTDRVLAAQKLEPDANRTQEQIDKLLADLLAQYEQESEACEAKFQATSTDAAFAREQARVKALPGVRIGMTMKQVVEQTHWGKPISVNRTTTARGTREQWVYGDKSYLYFENGVLTAIQN